MIGDTWVAELRERSKNDHAMIVGSEVRQLCGEVDRLRAALSASEERAKRAEAERDEIRAFAQSANRRAHRWFKEAQVLAKTDKERGYLTKALEEEKREHATTHRGHVNATEAWFNTGERLQAALADAERLREGLRDVADFRPLPGQPSDLWCWCGYDHLPAEHHGYCRAARAALEGGGRNGR